MKLWRILLLALTVSAQPNATTPTPIPSPHNDFEDTGSFYPIVLSAYSGALVVCLCANYWRTRQRPLLQDELDEVLVAEPFPMTRIE